MWSKALLPQGHANGGTDLLVPLLIEIFVIASEYFNLVKERNFKSEVDQECNDSNVEEIEYSHLLECRHCLVIECIVLLKGCHSFKNLICNYIDD